ncbi:TetR/AcrR family transcriptional regulator [Streptosporangium sp. NBC_01639]|uniref:TetR/AcrR family transcriptional regulator n=1 Tax=Streptosporangium sp. NBC_01639 TaxID=2975948 RepID=UPI00386F9447|nr:TetR/AcrR family transcriptional regulator [Streptosporangium sp. NBC_01639]
MPRPPARDRLLAAARELFYANGYSVSIDAVTERANVAKPTVYAHFKSKDALIGVMLTAACEEWLAELDTELERRSGDPLGQLLAPFDLLAANLPDPAYHGCILVNSAAAFLSPEHPAHHALATHDERMLALFERLAAEAGARQPAVVARQLLLLYDGVKTRGLVDNTGAAARDARAAATALVTR